MNLAATLCTNAAGVEALHGVVAPVLGKSVMTITCVGKWQEHFIKGRWEKACLY